MMTKQLTIKWKEKVSNNPRKWEGTAAKSWVERLFVYTHVEIQHTVSQKFNVHVMLRNACRDTMQYTFEGMKWEQSSLH